jgi:hypothetical protein
MLHSPVKHFNITPTCPLLRTNSKFLGSKPALATVARRVATVAAAQAMIATRFLMAARTPAVVARRVAMTATRVAGHLSAPAAIARPFLTIARRVAMVAAAQATIATDPLKANKPHLGTISQDFHHFFNRFASASHKPGGARHKTISYG